MDLQRRRDRERYARELAYAAPSGMVAAATAARLAGDWRGACAAAGVDVRIDPSDAAFLDADLAGLAPDLLRRHLPRAGNHAVRPALSVVLSRRATVEPRTPVLLLTTPATVTASQRLELTVSCLAELDRDWLDLPPWTWHASEVADRRWAYGASAERVAWHFADGTAYPQGTSTPADPVPDQEETLTPADLRGTADPAPDRAAEFERLLRPIAPEGMEEGMEELYRSAGLDTDDRYRSEWYSRLLTAEQDRLPLLAAETRRLAGRYGELATVFPTLVAGGLELRVSEEGTPVVGIWNRRRRRGGPPSPYGLGLAAPLDVALLRWGALSRDELHPLVHAALFPGRVQRWRPVGHNSSAAIRVRCGADWHLVEIAGASLRLPDHDEAEVRRETMLAVLGGRSSGCAAALAAFRTGKKPMPKEIRKWRRHFFARLVHGDSATVLADLAAGCDPLLRDPQGRTLRQAAAAAGAETVVAALPG
ncbi:hypothetical protein [Actinoplanes awajinensis]|uniref:Uncharacterized protein n=1 Tax=Actinoplanes awajinensis subsp. mycoplanecinus TaxID=135947 RepID=A0A117MSA0_9ACTN|nr:hypothetical protein [Actinoplanes awajinensis]KUL33041.1 hypothetical protein ADL15_18690 [Actinoplanes awajinensis subsp. mycoplanecinus]